MVEGGKQPEESAVGNQKPTLQDAEGMSALPEIWVMSCSICPVCSVGYLAHLASYNKFILSGHSTSWILVGHPS